MSDLVLSLFPGIGLLDMAFEEEGFCVVRGPDLLWGGDIRRFHPPVGRFDGVIGGPPCQAFSRLRHLVEHNGYKVAENLIPEFERVIAEAQPEWFLMENVPAAPVPVCPGYRLQPELVRDDTVGGETSRTRRFTFGGRYTPRPSWLGFRKFHIDTLALHQVGAPAVLAGGGYRSVPVAVGGSGKRKSTKARDMGWKTAQAAQVAQVAQGLPEDFDLPGFTVAAKCKAIGNGVPIAMGRAVARAVRGAISAVPVAERKEEE